MMSAGGQQGCESLLGTLTWRTGVEGCRRSISASRSRDSIPLCCFARVKAAELAFKHKIFIRSCLTGSFEGHKVE